MKKRAKNDEKKTHMKNVPFAMNFSSVDFVEQCHHDKRVENDGEVLGGRRMKRGPTATFDFKEPFACNCQFLTNCAQSLSQHSLTVVGRNNRIEL